ncbi:hypothetical protein [uncultured Parabacteroides sp.]|jgi:hypothetical protein|uniref:hypothetical protein n=1 Tax=uncultured Parabacteroides sp. TaxID=512312 RepID=UPI00258408DB|nr:hypothetical protein [uncultured Parabacteroides sp.]
MVKAFSILFFSILLFTACEKDTPEEDKKNDTPFTPDINSPWYGIHTHLPKDFDFNIGSIYDLDANTYGIGGASNNHIWLGKFNRISLKPDWIFLDKKIVPHKLNAHVGYGEYYDFELKKVGLDALYEDDDYKIAIASLRDGSQHTSSAYNLKIFFTRGGKELKCEDFTDMITAPTLIRKWYNNSVVLRVKNREKYYCYSYDGNLLYEFINEVDFYGNPHFIDVWNAHPINQTDGITSQMGGLFRINYKNGEMKWHIDWMKLIIDVPPTSKTKYYMKPSNTDIWEYVCEITTDTGLKYSKSLKFDINTGVIL